MPRKKHTILADKWIDVPVFKRRIGEKYDKAVDRVIQEHVNHWTLETLENQTGIDYSLLSDFLNKNKKTKKIDVSPFWEAHSRGFYFFHHKDGKPREEINPTQMQKLRTSLIKEAHLPQQEVDRAFHSLKAAHAARLILKRVHSVIDRIPNDKALQSAMDHIRKKYNYTPNIMEEGLNLAIYWNKRTHFNTLSSILKNAPNDADKKQRYREISTRIKPKDVEADFELYKILKERGLLEQALQYGADFSESAQDEFRFALENKFGKNIRADHAMRLVRWAEYKPKT